MRAGVDESGAVVFSSIDWLCVVFLARIPQLLVADDPATRARLYPDPFEPDPDEPDPDEPDPDEPDPDAGGAGDGDNAQWRRFVHPELKSLFASRAAIVRGDLAGLATDDGGETYRLTIPAAHVSAWEAALVGASHALYARHDLSPADVQGAGGELGDPERALALVGIEYHSRVLWMLLGVLDPDQRDVVADDDEDDEEDADGAWDGGGIPPLDS